MAVLVTGGAGYIGSQTCVHLLEAGKEIVVIDNFSNSSPKSSQAVREITGKDFPLIECDIRDEEKLSEIFSQYKIEAVIHFAGLKAVGESCQKPLEYYDNNIGGTVKLLSVMKKFGVKCIVFSSSATVYGEKNVAPFNEEMEAGGTTNPYGTTKLYIEQILKDLCASDSEWSACLLRYFNPIGAHESGKIGEAPNGIPNNLMPYIAQVAVGKRERLSIYGNDYDTPDGTGVRDYIHVADLADGHVCALERALSVKGCEIYNLGTGKGVSVLELVKAFEEASGVQVPYVITDRRPGDIATSYADASKAERVLGWKTKRSAFDACRDTWNWQKKNPNGFDD